MDAGVRLEIDEEDSRNEEPGEVWPPPSGSVPFSEKEPQGVIL
jgi:hypothetical protein